MKVSSGGNLGISNDNPEKLFGPILYSWCNCLLSIEVSIFVTGRSVHHDGPDLQRPGREWERAVGWRRQHQGPPF